MFSSSPIKSEQVCDDFSERRLARESEVAGSWKIAVSRPRLRLGFGFAGLGIHYIETLSRKRLDSETLNHA
jgi:hypothetical protein